MDTITTIDGTNNNGTFSSSIPIISGSYVVNSTAPWSDNVNWNYSWVCQACGVTVYNGSWHACNSFQLPQPQPHKCPVCEGRTRVLFDPENPYARHSAVETWPCKVCDASGVLWR